MNSTVATSQAIGSERVSDTNRRRSTIFVRVCAAVFLGWLAVCGALVAVMRQPPATFGRVMSHVSNAAFLVFPFETMWTHARSGQLQPGDLAPDFSLLKLDKTASIQLSSLASQKPVVLVFGSYT